MAIGSKKRGNPRRAAGARVGVSGGKESTSAYSHSEAMWHLFGVRMIFRSRAHQRLETARWMERGGIFFLIVDSGTNSLE